MVRAAHGSKASLEAKTAAFLGEKGAWAKFTAAKKALDTRTQDAMRNQGVVSHRPELTMEQAKEITCGHYGLGGEMGNGPGSIVNFELVSNLHRRSLQGRVREVVDCFESKRSQLTGGSSGRPNEVSEKIDISGENCRQALARCADEIEAWAAANSAVLDNYEATSIARDLKHYRSAYAKVLEYVDYAKGVVGEAALRQTER